MRVGKFNQLTILRFTSPGAYLGDDEDNDVLLPGKYIQDHWTVGDQIDVFLYKDSEDRLVATTETPFLTLKEFAYLKVKEVNAFGAFLDWGLEKDLLVPFKEQQKKMTENEYYLVTLQIDSATDRLFASTKISKFLSFSTNSELLNQQVDLLICEQTDLGRKVIVNNQFHGLIFRNSINQVLQRGQKTIGYVANVRDDGKLDIQLDPFGLTKFRNAAEQLLSILRIEKSLPYTDNSDPDEIREHLRMSKKTFKQAIGNLYKAKLISLNENGIFINE